MIVLTVLSYKGAPTEGLSGGFDELGGTIGRADTNHLVLPDPERTISRVHARVVYGSSGYSIVDNGSNPVVINGVALGSGREHPLKPGDRMQIGGYLLRASEPAPAPAAAQQAPAGDTTRPVRTGPVQHVPPQPPGAVYSWDGPPRDGRVVTLPGVRRPKAAAAPASELEATVRRHPAEAALLAALQEGLGAPGLQLEALTPELMHRIGELLREAAGGVVELLLARSALKREMRAAVTTLVARENNPLKFSPSAEVALQHLLGPAVPGFIGPAPAMRDAFDDLLAHQHAMVAGMKAASEGVLQCFDPAELEARLSKRSALDGLIPATRKARLWELFEALFSQLSDEAQHDFDALFGKAFVKAYQDQLDRPRGEPDTR